MLRIDLSSVLTNKTSNLPVTHKRQILGEAGIEQIRVDVSVILFTHC